MKRHAPATERNREPILEILRRVLPERGIVLEIASGTGQHAVHFAAGLPGLVWQPSDVEPDALESVRAWRADADLHNLAEPVELDASAPRWPVEHADVVVNINMIHISPWTACEGLLRGAGRIVPAGGVLFLYGPFLDRERPTAPSNEAFDRSLRVRDPRWGLRWLHEVEDEADRAGFALEATFDMPANNRSVVFRRRGDG